MSQNYTWPSVSVQATNPSVGTNGSTAPTSATEVAGVNPSGNLQPLQTDASGNLLVNLASPASPLATNIAQVGGSAVSLGQKLEAASIPVVLASDEIIPISASALPLPAGAATAANQASEITQLTGIHSDTTSLDGKTVHVDTGAVVVASSALPSGAATAALQTSGNSSLSSILAGQTSGTQITQVSNFPATQPVSGTVTVVQPTGSNLHVAVDSSALPTGAATESTLGALNTAVAARLSGSLVPAAYNEIDLTYTGSNITLAVYKLAGTTVKTLTLTYTGDNLTSVVAS